MPCRGPDDDEAYNQVSNSAVRELEARLADMKKQRDQATAAACNLFEKASKKVAFADLLPETVKWFKEHKKHDEARARKAFEAALKKLGPDAVATILGDME